MNTQQAIDFSLLDNLKLQRVRRQIWLTAAIGVIAPFLFVNLTTNDSWLLLWWLLLVPGLLIWWFAAKAQDAETFKAFAVANGFEYHDKISHFGSGSIFTHGHSRRGQAGLVGQLQQWPTAFFRYKYTVGSGKSQATYDATVMRITLPRVLPHMVIDSVVEAGNGGASTLPIKFDKDQRIELEGDFHKYFDLYAPDSYGISALTILAPDAMEVLLQHAALCDIEIIDNYLYLYWPDVAANRTSIEDKFKTTQEVLAAIGDKLARGDIFAQAQQAALHNPTATTGVRLAERTYWVWLLVALGFFGFIIMIIQFPERMAPLAQLFNVVWPLGFLGFGWVRSRRRRRLQRDLERRYPKQ